MQPLDMYRKMVEAGLPEHVAEGFMDNFKAESGLNAGINEINPTVKGSRGGRGLYQLTGPRRDAFEEQYGEEYDPEDQIDFMLAELEGPESKAMKKIMETGDREGATKAISQHFLRPAKDNSDARVGMWGGGGRSMPNPRGEGSPVAKEDILQALFGGHGGVLSGEKKEPMGPGFRFAEDKHAGLVDMFGEKGVKGLSRGLGSISDLALSGSIF